MMVPSKSANTVRHLKRPFDSECDCCRHVIA